MANIRMRLVRYMLCLSLVSCGAILLLYTMIQSDTGDVLAEKESRWALVELPTQALSDNQVNGHDVEIMNNTPYATTHGRRSSTAELARNPTDIVTATAVLNKYNITHVTIPPRGHPYDNQTKFIGNRSDAKTTFSNNSENQTPYTINQSEDNTTSNNHSEGQAISSSNNIDDQITTGRQGEVQGTSSNHTEDQNASSRNHTEDKTGTIDNGITQTTIHGNHSEGKITTNNHSDVQPTLSNHSEAHTTLGNHSEDETIYSNHSEARITQIHLGNYTDDANESFTNKVVTQTPQQESNILQSKVDILMVGYQRTGSSYLGNILFNTNPDIFYLYEPLDQLYSAMYGVAPGWSVPGDITITKNGSYRIMPDDELHAVVDFLQQFYSCDVMNFLPQVYTHMFWDQFSSEMKAIRAFTGCRRIKLHHSRKDVCLSFKTRHCKRVFDGESVELSECKKYLWHHETLDDHKKEKGLLTYESCEKREMTKVKPCFDALLRSCGRQNIRAIKTVRGTMEEAKLLMERNPQLKVIHLMRDPRAVVVSRHKAGWSRSLYEKSKSDSLHTHTGDSTSNGSPHDLPKDSLVENLFRRYAKRAKNRNVKQNPISEHNFRPPEVALEVTQLHVGETTEKEVIQHKRMSPLVVNVINNEQFFGEADAIQGTKSSNELQTDQNKTSTDEVEEIHMSPSEMNVSKDNPFSGEVDVIRDTNSSGKVGLQAYQDKNSTDEVEEIQENPSSTSELPASRGNSTSVEVETGQNKNSSSEVQANKDEHSSDVKRRSKKSWDSKLMGRIASVYCDTALRDYQLSLEIKQLYPDRIITVWYDDYILDPGTVYQSIYTFLDLNVPHDLNELLDLDNYNATEALAKSQKWRSYLSTTELQAVVDECGEFEKETGQNWFSDNKLIEYVFETA